MCWPRDSTAYRLVRQQACLPTGERSGLPRFPTCGKSNPNPVKGRRLRFIRLRRDLGCTWAFQAMICMALSGAPKVVFISPWGIEDFMCRRASACWPTQIPVRSFVVNPMAVIWRWWPQAYVTHRSWFLTHTELFLLAIMILQGKTNPEYCTSSRELITDGAAPTNTWKALVPGFRSLVGKVVSTISCHR